MLKHGVYSTLPFAPDLVEVLGEPRVELGIREADVLACGRESAQQHRVMREAQGHEDSRLWRATHTHTRAVAASDPSAL